MLSLTQEHIQYCLFCAVLLCKCLRYFRDHEAVGCFNLLYSEIWTDSTLLYLSSHFCSCPQKRQSIPGGMVCCRFYCSSQGRCHRRRSFLNSSLPQKKRAWQNLEDFRVFSHLDIFQVLSPNVITSSTTPSMINSSVG